MKGNERLGTVIIDELRLCYTAKPLLLDTLRVIDMGERIYLNECSLLRTKGQHFNYQFVLSNVEDSELGTLYFGQFGDEDSCFIWLKVANEVLYNTEQLTHTLSLCGELGMLFHHITAIDLAVDSKKNFVSTIRKLYKDKGITTIINGKSIQDRKRIIPEIFISYNVSLDRLCSPTFYCRQKKALHDKTKGVCVCSYNKRAEIEQESEKEYILDFYGHPKKLHRLEVHLNSQEMRDYFTSRRLEQELDVVFNKELLTEMFYYHLGAVIRFTNGRKKIDWRNIIEGK